MKLPKVFAGSRRRVFGWLLLNGFAQAVLSLAAVVTFDRFVASGFSDPTHVMVMSGLAAGVYTGRILQRRHGEMFALDYVNQTRLALMEKVLSTSDTRNIRLGAVTTRLGSDLLALRTWLSEGVATSLVMGTTLLMLLAGAIVLYWQVALILACVIIPWATAVIGLRPFLMRAIGSGRTLRGRLAAVIGDRLTDRLTLAHFGKTQPVLEGLSRRGHELNEAIVRRSTISEAMRAIPEWGLPIASLAGFWMLSGGNGMAAPNAAPLLLLLGMTGSLLAGLSRSIDLHLASRLAMRRLSSQFNAPSVDHAASAGPPGTKRGAAVELGLRFFDESGKENIFAIAPGAVVSLTGGSQGQRSNILASMARLRDDPTILATIGGIPSGQIPIRNWRKIITLASPRLPLIRDTIRKNLTIGAPRGTPDEEVLDLARRFGIAGELDELNATIEPNTIPARTAIAMRLCRSVIRKASVILLDEVTSTADFPLIAEFMALAKKRQVSVITSGCVVDDQGRSIGDPIAIPC